MPRNHDSASHRLMRDAAEAVRPRLSVEARDPWL